MATKGSTSQHTATIYFPLLVPECFLIEPTETVTEAPFTQPVRRLDEVKAANGLDLV